MRSAKFYMLGVLLACVFLAGFISSVNFPKANAVPPVPVQLSRRDMMAATAMQVYIQNLGPVGNSGREADIAKEAVRMADFLIKELDKK